MTTITDISNHQHHLILQKLAVEAFDIFFEGDSVNAKHIFLALKKTKSGHRPASIGLALIDLLSSQQLSDGDKTHQKSEDDVLRCFQGLTLLKQGKATEASILLNALVLSDDDLAAQLAKDIIKYEINHQE